MGFLGWCIVAIVILIVFFAVKSGANKAADREREQYIDGLPRIAAANKAIVLPILAGALREEFPDPQKEITELSLSEFYDKISWWVAAYDTSHSSKGLKEHVIDDRPFSDGTTYKENLRNKSLEYAPEPLKAAAENDFTGWWNKMDRVIKFSVEKALASGYQPLG